MGATTMPVVVVESERSALQVTGSDRQSWLDGILSCDLSSLPTRGAYGLLLTKQGKISTDVDVVANGDRLLLSVVRGQTDGVVATLDRMLIMEDAELERCGNDLACVRVHGSDAMEWLRQAPPHVAARELGWTAAGGCCVFVERAAVEAWRALERAGAWDELRVEHGFGLFGVDFDGNDNPHEAALDRRAVSFSKGCYLGQEVVCMQDMRGKVKRRLSILELDASAVNQGASVYQSDTEVGRVTSVAPSGQRCLAQIVAPHYEVGSLLTCCGVVARVVAPPSA
ncbi:MAG: hypothetical protein R3B13_24205 [Polyangiaceae bacterium]